jgi:hypothetical protein
VARSRSRSRSNVERIRQPIGIRHVVRGLLLVAGVVGGIVVAWSLTPQTDLLSFDVALARGALLGLVVGLGAAALVPLREAPPTVVHPRPSGFDALRAELEAERARATAEPRDRGAAPARQADPAPVDPAPADPAASGPTATDPGEVTHA